MADDRKMERIEVAVVGVGRMGGHHARIYAGMDGVDLVAVVDGDAKRAGELAAEYGCAACGDVGELLEKFPGVGGVTVAVPTVGHVGVAEKLLERGVGCLIEKPLAGSAAECERLVQAGEKGGGVLGVGHIERFNPAFEAYEKLGWRPGFIEATRVSPMPFRSLDVSVVMDLMIHDLDLILAIARSDLVEVSAVGRSVLSPTEDVANARLTFGSGCVANVTASRLALKSERRIRVLSDGDEGGFVELDFAEKRGTVVRMVDHLDRIGHVRRMIGTGVDLSDLDYCEEVKVRALVEDGAVDGGPDALTKELADFVGAVRTGGEAKVSGRAGCAAVEAAERVLEAIRR